LKKLAIILFILSTLFLPGESDANKSAARAYYYWVQLETPTIKSKPQLFVVRNGSSFKVSIKKVDGMWRLVVNTIVKKNKIVKLSCVLYSDVKGKMTIISRPIIKMLINTLATISQSAVAERQSFFKLKIYPQKVKSTIPPKLDFPKASKKQNVKGCPKVGVKRES